MNPAHALDRLVNALTGACSSPSHRVRRARVTTTRGARRPSARWIAGLLVTSWIAPFASAQTGVQSYSPDIGADDPMMLYWGDTHVHSSYSMDANYMGNRLNPADAYRFARGEEVEATPGARARIRRPLDFLVVADHAEFLGVIRSLRAGHPALRAQPQGERWYQLLQEGGDALQRAFTTEGGPLLDLSTANIDPWREMVAAADEANVPGVFTALSGFEWSSTPDGNNLHRNVIFRDGPERTLRVRPFSSIEHPRPEELWHYLEEYEHTTGGRVLAIPHNSNLSNGLMFPDRDATGETMTITEAEQRARWEPVVEVTQTKGDSEAHPLLSPEDALADYGTWDKANIVLVAPQEPWMFRFAYARPALKTGLRIESERGVNPYRFGMIGSTDSHTALATAEEDNFWGKFTKDAPSPTRARGLFLGVGRAATVYAWELLASGYAAVWARENTREEIFDALARREVYATTGSRIAVRFFGGWDYEREDAERPQLARTGYRKGVPMGAVLPSPTGSGSPRFLVQASRDPEGANLDRVQIVKGWLDARGETHEKVHDVAWSDDRERARGGTLSPVGSTADPETATYRNTIGAPELATVWTDPDFDPTQPAFYYARVVEIPTPRWVAYDRMRLGAEIPSDAPQVHQERAYTSPIWYAPPKPRSDATPTRQSLSTTTNR